MSAVEAVSGNVLATVDDRASNRDGVLAVATDLVAEIREALGDDLSDSARRFAQDTLSTTSLEVIGGRGHGGILARQLRRRAAAILECG